MAALFCSISLSSAVWDTNIPMPNFASGYLTVLRFKKAVKQVGLTKDLFEKWMEPTANELESNRYRRVNELINFSRFLNDLGLLPIAQGIFLI